MMRQKDWKGLRVVIVGAARQGIALAKYLIRHGARVVLNDLKTENEMSQVIKEVSSIPGSEANLEMVFGGHPLSMLEETDLLCLSGGIPLTIPLVGEARARGIPFSNDSQIFLEVAPCQVIGITGSAGKTTTTTIVGRIAEEAINHFSIEAGYRRVWVGGNIGSPLITEVDDMSAEDLAVVELSSFQLELMTRSPQVAAILNLTPNHLDRHITMEAYKAAKSNILNFQTEQDVAVLGHEDPIAWSLAANVKGGLISFGRSAMKNEQGCAYLKDDQVTLRQPGDKEGEVAVLSRNDISIKGEHNLLNVIAACAISAAAGFPVEAMKAGVQDFMGVPHRLEFVRSWGGADWYNDSIATAPERAMAAIRSFDEPLVLMAGGRDKALPWGDFAALVKRRVRHLILFGEARDKINNAMSISNEKLPEITHCDGLEEAVLAAAQIVQPGDVVLLSPGGTSFDEFKDFEERGKCFTEWVMNLP